MPTSFLSLPAELRNIVYSHLLIQDLPFDPWTKSPSKNGLATSLLLANKHISHEASSVLYGQNMFDFSPISRWHVNHQNVSLEDAVASFLKRIGEKNASCIRRVCIDFPRLEICGKGVVRIVEHEMDVLAMLEASRQDLRRVTLLWPDLVTEGILRSRERALEVVDERLRTGKRTLEVEVELDRCCEEDRYYVQRARKVFGWKFTILRGIGARVGSDDGF